ncbi:MAG TPA: DUF4097 family beta strand repeat-containing protein [Thermoanaerobaculia bacterium]|nr:DUF4097 family beta strand repeat-containing protein [Thermoanaerobaculia bacterium]
MTLLAVACGRAEGNADGPRRAEKSVTITRNWPAAGIRDLKVAEVDGSISVEASATDEISLVATAEGDLDVKAGQENDGLFVTKLEGSTLSIGRRDHSQKPFVFNIRRLLGRGEKRINYALRVPPTVSLDVNTVNGRIVSRGMSGATDAATVNGSIDIETAGTHELQATSVNGPVRAKFLESFQGARFRTVNGGVEAILPQSASFNIDLSQVNGDFEASFPLSIHSNPGSRRVSGEVNGGHHQLKITTVNGDVQLARLNGSL